MSTTPDSQPPEPIFVVFCRICGIGNTGGAKKRA